MPVLAPLTADDFAEPITPVLPMGRLQNTLRVYLHGGQPTATGFFPVGDACCHTSPAFALGLSMSLLHPLAVARALAEHPDDPVAQALAYWDAVLPEARERYEFDEGAGGGVYSRAGQGALPGGAAADHLGQRAAVRGQGLQGSARKGAWRAGDGGAGVADE